MHTALYAVELAQLQGNLPPVLEGSRLSFMHWTHVELNNNITQTGEDSLAKDIQVGAGSVSSANWPRLDPECPTLSNSSSFTTAWMT